MNMRQSGFTSSGYVSRGWIIFYQVFGTFIAMISLGSYIFYMSQLSDALANNGQMEFVETKALVGLILAILVYLAWKTIYTAIVIIRFVNSSDDETISANRYIISALSLNLGGLCTPFVMTRMPNVETRSTINSRWFLSRTMGVTSLVGGILSLGAYFASVLTGQFGNLTTDQLFDTTQTGGIIGVVVLSLGLAISFFGLISIALFYQKFSNNIFENGDTGFSKLMNFVAVIWLAIITVELFITMFFAVIRLLGALLDVARAMTNSDRSLGILIVFMALLKLLVTLVFVGYILSMTFQTMIGIWSKDGVQHHVYERLAKQEASRKQPAF